MPNLSTKEETAMLSKRETQILSLIIDEYTTNEIAAELFLTSDTVKTHRKNLLSKMGARNVAGLVRRAFEHNFVSYTLVQSA